MAGTQGRLYWTEFEVPALNEGYASYTFTAVARGGSRETVVGNSTLYSFDAAAIPTVWISAEGYATYLFDTNAVSDEVAPALTAYSDMLFGGDGIPYKTKPGEGASDTVFSAEATPIKAKLGFGVGTITYSGIAVPDVADWVPLGVSDFVFGATAIPVKIKQSEGYATYAFSSLSEPSSWKSAEGFTLVQFNAEAQGIGKVKATTGYGRFAFAAEAANGKVVNSLSDSAFNFNATAIPVKTKLAEGLATLTFGAASLHAKAKLAEGFALVQFNAEAQGIGKVKATTGYGGFAFAAEAAKGKLIHTFAVSGFSFGAISFPIHVEATRLSNAQYAFTAFGYGVKFSTTVGFSKDSGRIVDSNLANAQSTDIPLLERITDSNLADSVDSTIESPEVLTEVGE